MPAGGDGDVCTGSRYLIDNQYQCLFFLGPTDRYLHVAPGQPTHDLLAMVRPDMRNKLRSAIQQVNQQNTRVVVPGGRMRHDGVEVSFSIDLRPVSNGGEELLVICFVEEPKHEQKPSRPARPRDVSRIEELERELEATKMELQGAIRSLEISSEDQKAINEEALSVNEEYQSTNEELLTSKEELQSLNEEKCKRKSKGRRAPWRACGCEMCREPLTTDR